MRLMPTPNPPAFPATSGSPALSFSAHRLMQQLGKNPQVANAYAPCFELALCAPDVPAALAQAVAAGATPMV